MRTFYRSIFLRRAYCPWLAALLLAACVTHAAPGPFDWSWQVDSNNTVNPRVEVTLTPTGSVQCSAFIVGYPAVLTASSASTGGVVDPDRCQVRWGPYTNGAVRTVSFLLAGEPGSNYVLTCTVSWDGEHAAGPSTQAVSIAEPAATPRVPSPVFNPVSGTRVPVSVTISNTEPGVTIYYTTNGMRPTAASAVYSGPVELSRAATLRAIACKANMVDSLESVAYYESVAAGSAVRTVERSPSMAPYFSVTVMPNSGVECYAYEEHLPPGIRASGISESGRWDEVSGVVSWGPFCDDQPREFSYTGVGHEGTYPVDGFLSVDGSRVRTTGDVTFETEANFDDAGFFLRIPQDDVYFHGVKTLAWAGFGDEWASITADIEASRDGVQHILERGVSINDALQVDTTTLADGIYEFRIIFRDAYGAVLGELTHVATVNNSVMWQGGTLAENQTWSNGTVHVVERNLAVAPGVTLTIEPGAVVKFAPGVGMTVQDGATVNASGTAELPVVLTALADDEVGGDTNLDGGTSLPRPGDWAGVTQAGSGLFSSNDHTWMYYLKASQSGTLAADEVWMSTFVYEVTGNITVPAEVTLTIQPGAVVKMHPGTQIYIGVGGTLEAEGTPAEPIIFTSIYDDGAAGDVNGDGDDTVPAAGDWRGLYTSNGRMTLTSCSLRYGGYSSAAAVYGTGGDAAVSLNGCAIEHMLDEGVYLYAGTGVIANCIIRDTDEALYIGGGVVDVVNGSVVSNRVALRQSGGDLDVRNMILSDSGQYGVQITGGTRSFTFNNVWNSGTADFSGIASPVGTDGNLSVNPQFRSPASGNYRLGYQSPMIDAGSSNAPMRDRMGAPRYDDPRTADTGQLLTNQAVADLGAFEFVETADSDVDLVVAGIDAPAAMTAGDQVTVRWQVLNRGVGVAEGAWHDEILLMQEGSTGAVAVVSAAEVLSSGRVGPGQAMDRQARVRVPGGVEGAWRWMVHANVRGEIFEGRAWTNNRARAASATTLDVPEVPLDGSYATGLFDSDARSHWYRLVPEQGQDLEISISASQVGCGVELFVGRGYLPTPQSFDLRQSQWNEPVANVLIPWESTEPCYILAYAAHLPAAGSAFSLRGRDMLFGLDPFASRIVGDAGNALLKITGWQLSDDVVYALHDGVGPVCYGTLFSGDSSAVYVTFDTTGLSVGTYDLVATLSGTAVTQQQAVIVRTAVPGHVETKLVMPSAARPGRPFTMYVEYENVGNMDAMAPMLWLESDDATFYVENVTVEGSPAPDGVTGYHREADGLMVLAINSDGPAGILPPGARGRIQVRCLASTGSDDMAFRLRSVLDPEQPVDWEGLEAGLRPAFVGDDTWGIAYQSLQDRMGSSYGALNAKLASDATYFSRFGQYIVNVDQLLAFELQNGALMELARRNTKGVFGYGNVAPWEMTVTTNSTGDVFIGYPGLPSRSFLRLPSGEFKGARGEFASLVVTGGLYQLTEKNGHTTVFDAAGRLQYWGGRNSNRLTCHYTAGRVDYIQHANGDTTAITYTPGGRVETVTDPAGREARYEYDASGELLESVSSDAGTTTYSYVTGAGGPRERALQTKTDTDGVPVHYAYDVYGRLTNVTWVTGQRSTSYDYTGGGAVRVESAAGSVRTVHHDVFGNVVQVEDPLGRTVSCEYGPDMERLRIVGPGGAVDFVTDHEGNMIGWTDVAGRPVSAAYDSPYARLTSIRDTLGQTLTYAYDDQGNRLSTAYPDGKQVKNTYDEHGNVLRHTTARGAYFELRYNDWYGVTQKVYSSGEVVGYEYDSHRNITRVWGPGETNRLDYDVADRLTNLVYGKGRSLSFTYDGGGRRSRMTDQDGVCVLYEYDALGRLVRLRDTDGRLIVAYTYDGDDQIVARQRGNGVLTTNEFNAAGQLVQRAHYATNGTVMDDIAWTYDKRGLPVSALCEAGEWRYGYDVLGQLTNCSAPSGREMRYAYDAAGNRLQGVDDGTVIDYVPNANNQYRRAGDTYYLYDDDGNLVSRTEGTQTWSYAYDVENRLVSVSGAGETVEFDYNLMGDLCAVTRDGVRTDYLVDPIGLGHVIAAYNESGVLIQRAVHGHGLEWMVDGGVEQYPVLDAAGNIEGLSGAAGLSLNAVEALPFAEHAATASLPMSYVNAWGAMEFGGLVYMRNRFYDPGTGRFLSRDPIGILGGLNLYRYAGNCPVLYADASGLDSESFMKARQDLLNRGYREVPDRMNAMHDPKQNKKFLKRNGLGSDEIILDRDTGQEVTEGPNRGTDNWVDPDGTLVDAWPYINPFFCPRDLGHGLMDVAGPYIGIPEAQNDGHDWDPFDNMLPWAGLPGFAGDRIGDWLRDLLGLLRKFFSIDPNDIIGPGGYGDAAWVGVEQLLGYTIRYENYSNATAAAQTIAITNQLDSDLDWSTFELDGFAMGTNRYDVPAGLQSYHTRIDMREELGLYVDFDAALDPATGEVIWNFTSIDPATGQLTEDPLAGFLPPNTNAPCGEGYVSYVIEGRTNAASGSEITALAGIVFDVNEVILTPKITNTLDSAAPTSAINALASRSPKSFLVEWDASDSTDSGVGSCEIYVAREDGVFVKWLTASNSSSQVFEGEPSVQYSFFSIARDAVGNIERAPVEADALTRTEFAAVAEPAGGLPDQAVFRWESATNMTYDVLVSTNIVSGFELIDHVPSTPPENVYTGRLSGVATRYFRIRVVP